MMFESLTDNFHVMSQKEQKELTSANHLTSHPSPILQELQLDTIGHMPESF